MVRQVIKKAANKLTRSIHYVTEAVRACGKENLGKITLDKALQTV